MSEGFDDDKIRVSLNNNEVSKLLKKYKKIKKYMRSPVFTIKNLDGTEKVVSDLLKEIEDG
jgi:hypothetical protein